MSMFGPSKGTVADFNPLDILAAAVEKLDKQSDLRSHVEITDIYTNKTTDIADSDNSSANDNNSKHVTEKKSRENRNAVTINTHYSTETMLHEHNYGTIRTKLHNKKNISDNLIRKRRHSSTSRTVTIQEVVENRDNIEDSGSGSFDQPHGTSVKSPDQELISGEQTSQVLDFDTTEQPQAVQVDTVSNGAHTRVTDNSLITYIKINTHVSADKAQSTTDTSDYTGTDKSIAGEIKQRDSLGVTLIKDRQHEQVRNIEKTIQQGNFTESVKNKNNLSKESSLCENCGTFDEPAHMCGITDTSNMAPAETSHMESKILDNKGSENLPNAVGIQTSSNDDKQYVVALKLNNPNSVPNTEVDERLILENPELLSQENDLGLPISDTSNKLDIAKHIIVRIKPKDNSSVNSAVDSSSNTNEDSNEGDLKESSSLTSNVTTGSQTATEDASPVLLSPILTRLPSNALTPVKQIETSHLANLRMACADHCYAGSHQRPQTITSNRHQSMDSHVSDLSQDSGFGEVHNSPDQLQSPFQESNSMDKLDMETNNNIQLGSPESQADTLSDCETLSAQSPGSDSEKKLTSLLNLPTGSCSSYHELNEVNKTRDAIIAIVNNDKMDLGSALQVTPTKSNSSSIQLSRQSMCISPKFGGKYRIGTFASVSNSSIGLESPTKVSLNVQSKKHSPSRAPKSLLNTIQGPVKHRLHDADDANRGVECPPDPSQSQVQHDHDYCLPPEAKSSSPHLMANLLKNTTFKHHQIKPAAITPEKRTSGELGMLGTNPRPISSKMEVTEPEDLALSLNIPSVVDSEVEDRLESECSKSTGHFTRPRSKTSERSAEYVRTGNSASKLKITGKFQDDYIYFLNTKSRSRRRKSCDFPAPIPANKIVVPPPKPGDIIVPHLTDADLEAIRLGTHPTIQTSNGNSRLLPSGGITTSASVTSTVSTGLPAISATGSAPATSASISDEENKLINTILSLETETSAPVVSSAPDFSGLIDSSALPSSSTSTDNLGYNFLNDEINLTAEQMEIIYSAMDEVESLDSRDSSPTSERTGSKKGSSKDNKSHSRSSTPDPIETSTVTDEHSGNY